MAPRPVEDEEDVIAVVVELGALAEVVGVLQRERVEAEDLAQLCQLIGVGVVEVQPEEVVAPHVVADARLVDAR